MTQTADIWTKGMTTGDLPKARRHIVIQDEHLTCARIYYEPGESNDFHFHDGTSQALFVIQGQFTVRTQHSDGTVTEHTIGPGQCALVGDHEMEQFENTGDELAVIYQVLRPDVDVVRDIRPEEFLAARDRERESI